MQKSTIPADNNIRPFLEKAQRSLECACESKDKKRYDSAISRLYYALFQICKELCVKKGYQYSIKRDDSKRQDKWVCEPVKHETRIRKAEIEGAFYRAQRSEIAILLNHLYTQRCQADYDMVPISEPNLNRNWGKAIQEFDRIKKEIL